jgi:uncharacterized repeat protein (TIGR01451 family)
MPHYSRYTPAADWTACPRVSSLKPLLPRWGFVKYAASFAVVLLFIGALGLALASEQAAAQGPSYRAGQPIPICHATGGGGYVPQSPDVDSILGGSGHAGHENDIIPPFDYEGQHFPGLNWDDRGRQIWAFGCDPSAVRDVRPLLECVEAGPTGLVAHFGYANRETSAVNIGVGRANMFLPGDANRSQPTAFAPGTHRDVFAVEFSGRLEWFLAGRSAIASADSERCQGSIEIVKALEPENDPGHFDLLLNGVVRAEAVGNRGTTGVIVVTAAPGGTVHTVSERAASGTTLADYETTIVCRNNGEDPPVAEVEGTSLSLRVSRGQAIVCVILNRRPEPVGPGQADVRIVKRASPRFLSVGRRVTWTVTVTNRGPDIATNVVVNDHLPDDMSFVSISVPDGVTCVGARCTLASLAPSASVTGSFIMTATAVGRKINVVTVDADQDDPRPANNVASAKVLVTSRAEPDVSPILECVDELSGGLFRAHFGYLNNGSRAVLVRVGPRNAFAPAPENRGQPVLFRPRRAVDVLQVEFEGTLAWTLTGRTVTASESSERCAPETGWLRVDKILRPPDDPGRFNLEINGVPAGTGHGVGHLGTTGDVAVPAGRHRVGEEGVGGTSLADYDITIVCRADRGRGAALSQFRGSSELVVDVAAGQEVVCTIVNRRRTGPPVPPLPPSPGPAPPGPGPPGTTDLTVQKFVSARVGSLGNAVTWTVVVTNNGPLVATGVRIVDQAAAGATFVSLEASQGTCETTTCSFGTIQPGGSVRVVARTRMLRVGARLNTVIVSGEQPDAIPENNAASALVRILAAFRPPLSARCGRLTVDRRLARAGTSVPVRATVRNVFGQPLGGTVVRARGAGQVTDARTNARGVATLQLSPTTPGIVRFSVSARTLTAAGARLCTARIGVVLPAPRPQFTG